MSKLDNFLDSRKRYLEALKQARITRGKRLWEMRDARRVLPPRRIKMVVESSPEVAFASFFQQADVIKTPETSIIQTVTEPVVEETERLEIPELSKGSLEPSTLKEVAIRINTEPTVIELGGGILQEKEKTIEPISEFIFRLPNGKEIGRAKNLEEFFELIRRGPLDSILYHANEEHFTPWLESIGYKKLAKKIKNTKGTSKKVRKRLLKIISRNR